MRTRQLIGLAIPMAALLAGCVDTLGTGAIPPAPSGLFYELEPSGDPFAPRGVVLRWDAVQDPNLASYNVYSRASTSDAFGLRGTTTSPSFHDDGLPHLEYYVTSANADGDESGPSSSVVIDERLRLPAPNALTSISLNGAIHLEWSDNPYQSDPQGFSNYRVYSTPYDLDNNQCLDSWVLEGTTVGSSFLSSNLTNGQPRCFGVSAVTVEGFESLWSPLRNDTPRPDGQDVIVYTTAGDPLQSGFRFFRDFNNDGIASPSELGLVGPSGPGNMDFTVTTDAGGNFLLVPQRVGTTAQQFGTLPIHDLTDIDIAPSGGYSASSLVAKPRFGYVFQMTEGAFYAYGALRVVATGTNYVIFDWSYQTDAGNPELLRRAAN
jgi:hypothetical protein